MKRRPLSEAARAKAIAEVRELLNELPGLHPERVHAGARFEGIAVAILSRVASILESGEPDARWDAHGPDWVKEIRRQWDEAMTTERV